MKEKPGILIPGDILAILRRWEAEPLSSYKYDMNDSDITTTGLKLGKVTRPAAEEIDISFQNTGYLKSVRRKAREDVSLQMTGLKSGTDSIDISIEDVHQLSNRYGVMHIATLHGRASRSGQRHGPVFIFEGPNQRREFWTVPIHTGLIQSSHYQM